MRQVRSDDRHHGHVPIDFIIVARNSTAHKGTTLRALSDVRSFANRGRCFRDGR